MTVTDSCLIINHHKPKTVFAETQTVEAVQTCQVPFLLHSDSSEERGLFLTCFSSVLEHTHIHENSVIMNSHPC